MQLTFVLDQLASRTPGGIGRYAANLAIAMAESSPENHFIRGNIGRVPASTESPEWQRVREALDFTERILPVQVSNRLWEHRWPFPRIPGIVHAPSLAAPLRKATHGSYVVPTIHDTVPWTHPETMTPHGVVWHRKMLELAWKFSPAVAVPTHAVADAVQNVFNFGDRIAVIPGASSLNLENSYKLDWDRTRNELGLARDFVLTVGTIEPRKGIQHLIELSRLENDFQVVHVGPQGWGQIDESGTTKNSFLSVGWVSDDLLRELYKNARCLVLPSRAEGFGLPVVEAMSLGCPVITTDDPALREVGGGLSTIIRPDASGFDLVREIQQAVNSTPLRSQQNSAVRENLVKQGQTYSWAASAKKAWRLHDSLDS